LTGTANALDAAVSVAETLVPRIAAVGDPAIPAVRTVRRESTTAKPRIIVDVAAPAGSDVTLFAEGPTADWALPLPERIAGAAAGLQRFAFALEGVPPGAKPAGATLRLTAVAGVQAVEVAFRLD
jgi:hypothetical protein